VPCEAWLTAWPVEVGGHDVLAGRDVVAFAVKVGELPADGRLFVGGYPHAVFAADHRRGGRRCPGLDVPGRAPLGQDVAPAQRVDCLEEVGLDLVGAADSRELALVAVGAASAPWGRASSAWRSSPARPATASPGSAMPDQVARAKTWRPVSSESPPGTQARAGRTSRARSSREASSSALTATAAARGPGRPGPGRAGRPRRGRRAFA
jgi:hypothetical protein